MKKRETQILLDRTQKHYIIFSHIEGIQEKTTRK